MNLSIPPESVVQRQLDAYNAHDIDALMTTYSADVQHFEFPATLVAEGAATVRQRLTLRLAEPDLHARLLSRTAMGNLVIDHELVTRNFSEGLGTVELIAMYEVQGAKIVRAWFKFGETRMVEPSHT
jgi:hypothetical protein